MYKIKLLTKDLYSRKLFELKKRYAERISDHKCYNHFKKPYETNEVYCNICDKSLKDQIGQNIVINTRSGVTKWVHITCAINKNIISKEWIATVGLVNTAIEVNNW